MSWRDQLRQGSYRGALFHIESADTEAGRRTARHDYPGRDLPFVEDLGRKGKEFTVECFVLGADYMAARDALLAACDQAGPGTLVHPYRGELTVVCTNARVRETTREGGMARFTLTFVEAGENRDPLAAPDTVSRVGAAADAASADSLVWFGDRFKPAGASFVADSAAGLVRGSLAETLLAQFGLLPAGGAGLLAEVGDLSTDADLIVRQPDRLGSRLLGLFRQAGLLARPIDAWTPRRRALDPLLGFADAGATWKPVPVTTASRRQQAANQDALAGLLRQGAAIEAARASSALDYSSYDDAVATRDAVSAALEAEIGPRLRRRRLSRPRELARGRRPGHRRPRRLAGPPADLAAAGHPAGAGGGPPAVRRRRPRRRDRGPQPHPPPWPFARRPRPGDPQWLRSPSP